MSREDLIKELERARSVSANQVLFQTLTSAVISELNLGFRDVGGLFGCTATTVERWIQGRACPHPDLHSAIYSTFIKLLKG